MPLYDLSHPITSEGSCTFARTDARPAATFQEGDSHGYFFIASALHNLGSNLCTHIDFPGHTLGGAVKPKLVGEYSIEHFAGNVAILDFRDKMEAVRAFFSDDGKITSQLSDERSWEEFIDSLQELEISLHELCQLFTK
jgi:kynurenine formamidase